MQRDPRVAIIGAGMSGICLTAMMRARGYDDIVIYEKSDRLGGTWRDNTYPGVACDVPSYFYQFTFDRNPNWSHLLSPGPEINDYLARVAADHGVVERTRFGVELTRATWVEGRWQLFVGDEQIDEVDFLVSATGILHHPRYPDIEGLDQFTGPIFHSSRWDHSVEHRGRRVGIIGTGSSGAQIIAATAAEVETLSVFQRTPQWVLRMPNPKVDGLPRAVLGRIPGVGPLTRGAAHALLDLFIEAVTEDGWRRRIVEAMARRDLNSVRDPELRAKLTPDFKPLCRRMIISNGYFDAIQRPNVEVVTDRITRIEPDGVRTADGRLHELDLIVLATGFDAHAYIRPMELIGRNGYTLDEAWANGPRAYRTVAQPGFPNYFTVMGPHSPVGNFSLTTIAENQSAYILGWLEEWRAGRVQEIEPTQEATDAFNAEVREAAKGTVWASGCTGWYLGQDGLPELWPWHPNRHTEMLAHPDPTEFTLVS